MQIIQYMLNIFGKIYINSIITYLPDVSMLSSSASPVTITILVYNAQTVNVSQLITNPTI